MPADTLFSIPFPAVGELYGEKEKYLAVLYTVQ